MKYRNDLTADYVRSILDYDPETGVFTWKYRDDVHACINGRDVGRRAGATTYHGYITIRINRHAYQAHRLAFLASTGSWPVDQLDHINGDKTDNRISNLRQADNSTNQKNQSIYKSNKSGHVGVSWDNRAGKWRAQIQVNGKQMVIGGFADKADAIAARQAASIKYGFHSNHGRNA